MEVDNRKVLIAIIIVTLLLLSAVAFTSRALQIVLSIPFVLFFPGWTLLSALFPKRGSLGSIERIALSFGLSIAITSLIGLILNYTPGGISLYPILISVTLFILVTSAIAWYRPSDKALLATEYDLLHRIFFNLVPRSLGLLFKHPMIATRQLWVTAVVLSCVAGGYLGYNLSHLWGRGQLL